MKRQIVGLFGFLLFGFCVLVVIWQLYQGTQKYLDKPVANKIYSQEVELPDITICHASRGMKIRRQLRKGGYEYSSYLSGKFLPGDPKNKSAQEIFEEATDYYYHLLDYTGCTNKV